MRSGRKRRGSLFLDVVVFDIEQELDFGDLFVDFFRIDGFDFEYVIIEVLGDDDLVFIKRKRKDLFLFGLQMLVGDQIGQGFFKGFGAHVSEPVLQDGVRDVRVA